LNHNRSRQTETDTVVVTDFDFIIDLTHLLWLAKDKVEIWTVDDTQPAYRGSMYQQTVVPRSHHGLNNEEDRFPLLAEAEDARGMSHKRRPKRQERKAHKQWAKHRVDNGLAPWATPVQYYSENGEIFLDNGASQPLRSALTVRAWADDYCASDKILKEFQFRKVPYGWNMTALTAAVQEVIRSAHYSGTPAVSFDLTASKITIKPSTRLSRTLSNPYLKALLWVLLIYPFIWLYRRYHKRGGGRWEVCGAAYALKRQEPTVMVNEGQPEEQEERDGDHRKGLGTKEGEWFKLWEGTIFQAVKTRVQSQEPLMMLRRPGQFLDGYQD